MVACKFYVRHVQLDVGARLASPFLQVVAPQPQPQLSPRLSLPAGLDADARYIRLHAVAFARQTCAAAAHRRRLESSTRSVSPEPHASHALHHARQVGFQCECESEPEPERPMLAEVLLQLELACLSWVADVSAQEPAAGAQL